MKRFIVEVKQKEIFPDPLGIATEKDADDAGITELGEIRVGQLYDVSGSIDTKAIQIIASKLLADPVTQDFTIQEPAQPDENKKGMRRIEVWFHSCVTDTVGETVKIGIADLGITDIKRISTGTSYTFKKDISVEKLKNLSQKLLANSMIQKCLIL